MKKPLQQIGLFDAPEETPAPAEKVVLSNTAPTPPRIVEIEEPVAEEQTIIEATEEAIETIVEEAVSVKTEEAEQTISSVSANAPAPPELIEVIEEEEALVEETAEEPAGVQPESVQAEPETSIATFAPTPPSIIEVFEEEPREAIVFESSEDVPAEQAEKSSPPSSISLSFIQDEDIPAQAEPVTAEEQPLPKRISSTRGRKSLKETAIAADLIQIPEDDVLFSKQYYSIGEVATMFRENQSLIRYWETEFDILQPRKNKKGDRFFRPVDIKNLVLIYDLLRRRKFTIEGAKDFLKRNKKADDKFAMIQSLEKIKSFLLELRTNL